MYNKFETVFDVAKKQNKLQTLTDTEVPMNLPSPYEISNEISKKGFESSLSGSSKVNYVYQKGMQQSKDF
jgi:hypothetical protein